MAALSMNRSDVAHRATALYEQSIRAQVETEENVGKMVIIDPETGAFAVDDNGLESSRRLHALHPGAQLFGIRIGYNVSASLGGVMERTYGR